VTEERASPVAGTLQLRVPSLKFRVSTRDARLETRDSKVDVPA
jgi:hypothetical protein